MLVCESPRMRDAALAHRCLCQPERYRFIFRKLLKVRLNHRSWSDSSVCHGLRQTIYPSIFHLLQRPPYVRKSSRLEIRLHSRRDVTGEPEAAVQRDADCSCSLSSFSCIQCDCLSYRGSSLFIEPPGHLL